MIRSLLVAGALAFAWVLVAGAPAAWSEEPKKQEPKLEKAGTVQLEEFEAGIGLVDAVWGKGEVEAGGQKRRFRLNGMGAGGAGGAKITATGTVYNMKDIGLFPGLYSEAQVGAVAAEAGKAILWLRNTNGVILGLHAKQEGFALTVSGNGIVIQFEK